MHLLYSGNIIRGDFNPRTLGGKGYHLEKLVKAGFNVPDFVVLPRKTISDLILPVRKKIELLVGGIVVDNQEDLLQRSKQIQRLIFNLQITTKLEEALFTDSQKVFSENEFVAVRSSAISEDGVKSSFAGQHQTFLYVTKSDLIQKVKACIASAYDANALNYRIINGISTKEIGFSVVIQKMIVAKKSGIGFSMDIHNNMADLILVAGYGVGEGVVEDKVPTDSYRVTRHTMEVSSTIVSNKNAMEFVPSEGLQIVAVKNNLKDASVLSDIEIEDVSKQVLKAEELIGTIADVEFSVTDSGKVFILQVRPVTAINLDELKILDNTNIEEGYPGVSLPLTYSIARRSYEYAFLGATKAFRLSKKSIELHSTTFANLLGHFQGKIYYRIDNWYKLISLVASSKKSIFTWEKSVGLKQANHTGIKLSLGNKLKVYLSGAFMLLKYRSGNRKFYKDFDVHYSFLKSFENQNLSLEKLLEHYYFASEKMFRIWFLTLINDAVTFISFSKLQSIIKRKKIGSNVIVNDLLYGKINSESEQAIIEMLKIKAIVQADSKFRLLFKESNETIYKILFLESESQLSVSVMQYIERFGDRVLGELKLENPSFRTDKMSFVKLLKAQLLADGTLDSLKSSQNKIHETAWETMNGSLKWWNPTTYLFKVLLQVSAYGLKNRENMRFCRTRIFGKAKDLFLEVGDRLVATQMIENKEDVFYLSIERITDLATNHSLNVKTEVTALKNQYIKFQSSKLPDRVMYIEEPPTDIGLPIGVEQHQKNTLESIKGLAVSKGIVEGEAMVVDQASFDINVKGKILVTKVTDPGWVFLMNQSVGLISERGSLLSHTAIVGRELGIPFIVGVNNAMKLIKTGDKIRLDGTTGTVTFLK